MLSPSDWVRRCFICKTPMGSETRHLRPRSMMVGALLIGHRTWDISTEPPSCTITDAPISCLFATAVVVVEDIKSVEDDEVDSSSGGGGTKQKGLPNNLSRLLSKRPMLRAKDMARELDRQQGLVILLEDAVDSIPTAICRRLALVVEVRKGRVDSNTG